MATRKKWVVAALALIGAVSVFLHVYRISYPAEPVFDEAHFATYASDYVTGTAFFDVHPPLGKLIYAGVLRLVSGGSFRGVEFVKWGTDSATGEERTLRVPGAYGDFPYVALRLVSGLFGLLLPIAMYFFLKNIGVGDIGAILGAFFIVFENALLLQTRLILLDGMYLVFGLGALAVYFGKKPRPLLAGVSWGLSLGVKFIGIVFAGPIIIYELFLCVARRVSSGGIPRSFAEEERKSAKKSIAIFFIGGIAVFSFVALSNNFFFSVRDRIPLWQEIGLGAGAQTSGSAAGKTSTATLVEDPPRTIRTYLAASLLENFLEVSENLEGGAHPSQSAWYQWPFMKKEITYSRAGTPAIVLAGNPVVWFPATIAVLGALLFLAWRLKKYLKACHSRANGNLESESVPANTGIESGMTWDSLGAPLILLSGYISALLPFATIIRRSTFLYHYFPALIFSIGLLAWGVEKIFKLDEPGPVSPRKLLILGLIICAVVGNFLFNAPATFGL